jgi:predicted  nucleic acid-binding Zn-ribbon protein
MAMDNALDPFNLFIDLISFDQKLLKNEADIKKLEEETNVLKVEIEGLKAALEQSKEIWSDLQKIVSSKELRIKVLDQLEKEKKAKLDQVQNQKEYVSIKKEIEKIKQEQYETEPELIESWNKAETAKKEYEAKKINFDQKIQELENNIENKKNSINNLDKELSELKSERNKKEKDVPEDWITKYNIMRTRVTNPVVPVQGNSCSACFYHITSQDLIDLNHKKLLQCKRCYRFLYIR